MEKVKEMVNGLKEGRILKVYFTGLEKEDADGREERTGVYPRGAEEGYLAEPGSNSPDAG